jgi:antitoxin component of MazEF toxin-antitoxin module
MTQEVLDDMGLDIGDEVEIEAQEGKIVITSIRGRTGLESTT